MPDGSSQSPDSIKSKTNNLAIDIETWFGSQTLIEVGFNSSGDEETPSLYVPERLLASSTGYFERLLDPANHDAFVEAKTSKVMLEKDERVPLRILLAWVLASGRNPIGTFTDELAVTPEAEISMLLHVAQLGDYLLAKDTSHLMDDISLRIAAILIEKRMALTDEHIDILYVIPNQKAVRPIRTIVAKAAVQPFMQQRVVQATGLDPHEWGISTNYDLKDASNKFQRLIDRQQLYAADVLAQVGNTIKSGDFEMKRTSNGGYRYYYSFKEPLGKLRKFRI